METVQWDPSYFMLADGRMEERERERQTWRS